MRFLQPSWPSLVFLTLAGCGAQEELSPLPSMVVSTDSQRLFYELTPQVSHGTQRLTISEDATEYIWLAGAYNNGRREENILIENTNGTIRMRSWWLTRSGTMWCLDSVLSADELSDLWRVLDRKKAFALPNVQPDVSHAMTYWIKVSDGVQQHEACAYAIDEAVNFARSESDKEIATDWRCIVTQILDLRRTRIHEIRPSTFDHAGNIIWNLPAHKDFDVSTAFQ